jgi:hypothetical protein
MNSLGLMFGIGIGVVKLGAGLLAFHSPMHEWAMQQSPYKYGTSH